MAPSTRREARILVAYFSRTGNTGRVAEALSQELRGVFEVETVEIVPTCKRSYLCWLAYSFVPDSEVDIENPEIELSVYDAVLLGFPKWTFSCPPLNRFIRKLRGVSSTKFFLFMTCGGFDDQRFLRGVTRKLTRIGCKVGGSLMVKRKEIRAGTYVASADSFAKRVEEQMRQPRKDFTNASAGCALDESC